VASVIFAAALGGGKKEKQRMKNGEFFVILRSDFMLLHYT